MPVRNMWSLLPGECFVSEEIARKTGADVFFPLKDAGIDLLAVKGERHVGIQVKESRHYGKHGGHSWHQLSEKKVNGSDGADFYVFLTYLPVVGETKVSEFQNEFLVVPQHEIRRRVTIKDSGKKRVFSFYFSFDQGDVCDTRVRASDKDSPLADYSDFRNAWHLIDKALA